MTKQRSDHLLYCPRIQQKPAMCPLIMSDRIIHMLMPLALDHRHKMVDATIVLIRFNQREVHFESTFQ